MAYPKIEGERLALARQSVRSKGDGAPIPSTDEFEALLNRPAGKSAAGASIESMLVDFIMPNIKDAGIFQENRIIMLLQHFRDEVLPQLNESSEMTQLATRVIEDEIARFTDLRERRQTGIAA